MHFRSISVAVVSAIVTRATLIYGLSTTGDVIVNSYPEDKMIHTEQSIDLHARNVAESAAVSAYATEAEESFPLVKRQDKNLSKPEATKSQEKKDERKNTGKTEQIAKVETDKSQKDDVIKEAKASIADNVYVEEIIKELKSQWQASKKAFQKPNKEDKESKRSKIVEEEDEEQENDVKNSLGPKNFIRTNKFKALAKVKSKKTKTNQVVAKFEETKNDEDEDVDDEDNEGDEDDNDVNDLGTGKTKSAKVKPAKPSAKTSPLETDPIAKKKRVSVNQRLRKAISVMRARARGRSRTGKNTTAKQAPGAKRNLNSKSGALMTTNTLQILSSAVIVISGTVLSFL